MTREVLWRCTTQKESAYLQRALTGKANRSHMKPIMDVAVKIVTDNLGGQQVWWLPASLHWSPGKSYR